MRIIIRGVIDARDYPSPAYARGMPILDRVLRLCRRAFFKTAPTASRLWPVVCGLPEDVARRSTISGPTLLFFSAKRSDAPCRLGLACLGSFSRPALDSLEFGTGAITARYNSKWRKIDAWFGNFSIVQMEVYTAKKHSGIFNVWRIIFKRFFHSFIIISFFNT